MRRSGLAVLAIAMALAACDGSSEPGPPSVAPVASVTITPGDISVLMQDNATINAVLKDADGNVLTERAITWASVSPSVATVDNAGSVYGQALGVALITATSEGKADTISASVVPVVVVSPRLPSVFTGDTTQLAVTLLTKNGTPAGLAPVTWSATTGGTTVDAAGLVHAGAPGLVQVTATAAGGTGTVDVAVIKMPGRVTRKVAWVYFDNSEGYRKGEVWTADADGANAVRVSPPEGNVAGYAWSPNGDRLAISTEATPSGGRTAMLVVSPDGTVLSDVSTASGYALTWSPDGSRIGYTTGTDIRVIRADGSPPEILVSGLAQWIGGPTWSPDSRTIAYGSDACNGITLMDADGTHQRPLDIPHRACSVLWSPDGKVLAYNRYSTADAQGAFLVSPSGGAPKPASPNCLTGPPCSDPWFQVIEWLSDGYTLAQRSVDFTAYNRQTGAFASLGAPDAGYVVGWSPDMTKVLGFAYPGAPTDLHARLLVWSAAFSSSQFITPADRDAYWATWQPSP